MAIHAELLEILACPKCKGKIELTEQQDALLCHACRLRYRIDDDIPIMLIDEAESVDDAEDARLRAKAESDNVQPTFAT